MRVVFLGTPDFGVPSLLALKEAGYEVVGVFTQPDRPKGRGNKTVMSPVKECALKMGVPVFQPQKIRKDGVEDLKALKPDLCVTAAFGQVLSQEILDIPTLGTVNVHSSLLPKYRGSAPVHYAIMEGEKVTGVTTMLTDKGMDTGDILLQKPVEILPGETTGELTDRLAPIGAELLIETVRLMEKGECPRRKQDENEASYFPMLTKEMGRIDWTAQADRIIDRIRGLSPWPGTYTVINGEVLKIRRGEAVEALEGTPGQILAANAKEGLVIRAGENAVRVTELQAQGGRPMSARDYLRGHALSAERCDEQGDNTND